MRGVLKFLFPVALGMLFMVPVSIGFTAVQVADARQAAEDSRRVSDVNACLGINRVSDAVLGVLQQARTNTQTSDQRTLAEKEAIVRYYDSIIVKFQPLDCAANPIVFEEPHDR